MKGFRNVMNRVSLDVTGKSNTWREEIEKEDDHV